MKALKFFLRMWGFIVGMLLTFAALPVGGECRAQPDDIRSALIEELGEVEKPTYVIGHTCPDSDTVCSAIAYANLKQQLNFKCEARVSGALNRESEFILKYFDVPTPPVLENAVGCNVILVDHNVASQAVSGIDGANILEIVDHHNLFGDIKSNSPVFYLRMPVGCTATIVRMCYRNGNVDVDKKMAGLMFAAILSDTDNLRSATTTNLDRQTADELQKVAEIDDRTKFFLDMEREFTDYAGMTEREIIFTDFKTFDAGGLNCGYSTVATLDAAARDEISGRLENFMAKNFSDTGVDMFFVKVHEIENYTAQMLAFGDGAREILAAALNLDAENLFLPVNVPNKKIARAISAVLENSRRQVA